MRTAVLVLAVAAAATLSAAQMLTKWTPGICSSDSLTPTVGVGCGVIGSDLDAYKPPSRATIRPIYKMVSCDIKCYFPGHETDPDCQYCVYVDPLHPDTPFKVPKNVFVMPWTQSDTCFESSVASSWDDVSQVNAHSHEHNGFFHWSSTVTETFLQRYFKDYASQMRFIQRYIYSSVVLMPGQQLDEDFAARIALLPTEYNATTQDNFFEFIENYGTHVINSVFTGGVADLTSYFESCLLTTYSGQWVYHESGSSFFGLFNHDHKHAQGFNHTSTLFKQYSNSTVNLYGGDGSKWGDFNWTRPATANYSAAWAATLYGDQVPAVYAVQALPEIFPPGLAAQAAALNVSIQAYFDRVSANNTAQEKAMGPRINPMPSWCKNPGALRGSDAPQAPVATPPPLPPCPDMLSELDRRTGYAAAVADAIQRGKPAPPMPE